MKVTIEYAEETTLEDFADKHGLELLVTETARPCGNYQFHARFTDQFYPRDRTLCYTEMYFGWGQTADEAIKDFVSKISGGLIWMSAPTKKDKENLKSITVPRLVQRPKPGTIIPVPKSRGFFARLFS
jgi:hypothetical protein